MSIGLVAHRSVTTVNRRPPKRHICRIGVFCDQPVHEALREAQRLGADLPGARVTGPVSDDALAELARRADGDFVAFADPSLELAWTQRVLGFGDAR